MGVKKRALPKPPASLSKAAGARWTAVAPLLADRARIDIDLLATYCQVWARWKQAEDSLSQGQLTRNGRGQLVASPMVAIANQTVGQLRALEKDLGLSGATPDTPAQASGDSTPERSALLTRRQLADVLGKHMQTVTKWEQDGMPTAKRGARGRPSLYREGDVRSWLDSREAAQSKGPMVDVARERARKELAQATLAEQTFQMRSRDLLPRVEVERAWEAEVLAVRTKLLQIPPTFADRVYQAAVSEGVGGVERILADSVNDVLRELAGDGAEAEAQPA